MLRTTGHVAARGLIRGGAGRTVAVCVATTALLLTTGIAFAATDEAEVAALRADGIRALEAAPVDASIWVRMTDGAGLMKSERFASLARTVGSKVLFREGTQRWQSLAKRLGLSKSETFDRYLGSDVRIAIRPTNGPSDDWAVLTRVAERDMDRVIQALRPAIGAGGRYELPEERLVLAYRAPWLVISGSASSELFADIAGRFDAPLDANLATVLKSVGISDLPPGRLCAVVKLPAPLEGRAVIAGDVESDHLRLSCRGSFARSPLPAAEQATLDVAVLRQFDEVAVASMLDPVRAKVGPDDAFLVALLPELVPAATFRGNLGPRRLLLIGEVDGGATTPKMNMRCPAVAVAYEVEDANQAREDQDALMKLAIEALRERIAKPQGLSIPPAHVSTNGTRSADIGDVLRAFTENHPLARTCSLNWTVVHGECGGWQIYATHPQWLAAVAASLSQSPRAEAMSTRAAHAGRCCGTRIATHIRSWNGEAAAFTGLVRPEPHGPGGPNEDAPTTARFGDGIELLASIVERFSKVQWTVGLPTERTISLEVTAELAPAPTSQR
ncbi:MAG: hypothetical protein SGJ09_11345 [Phycisphaerae bacterium]|nr:hypothetical protein [Phycisphaerae bacterium]